MKSIQPEFISKDIRRELIQLITDDIKQINVYKAKKGSILGNHFHKETKEYFYIIKGLGKYNGNQFITEGDFFLVEPPEFHKIECLNDMVFMTFLTIPYNDEKPDIYRGEN